MRKVVFAIALAMGLVWATAAQAAVETYLDCPRIPGCVNMTCVMIDVTCSSNPCECACEPKGPLFVDFLDGDNKVLGSAKIEGDWCACPVEAELDNVVDSNDVCAVRIVKADEDCDICAIALWARIEKPCDCGCGKWWKVWKGWPCEWNTIVEETPPPPPMPAPEPPRPTPPPPPAPAPRPLPPPPPAPEPEPIQTPGFG